jgi:hypothetical protein
MLPLAFTMAAKNSGEGFSGSQSSEVAVTSASRFPAGAFGLAPGDPDETPSFIPWKVTRASGQGCCRRAVREAGAERVRCPAATLKGLTLHGSIGLVVGPSRAFT